MVSELAAIFGEGLLFLSGKPLIALLSAFICDICTELGLAPDAFCIIFTSVWIFARVHRGSGTGATLEQVTINAAQPDLLALRITTGPRAATFWSLSNGVGSRKLRKSSKLRICSSKESRLR